jgi:ATP-dependent DNA helicase DinG
MVNRFLKHSNSILIGTSSFWEGVDFPGDKVEIVCIVKTPFSNPFDPMIKSKIEDYEKHGENAFLKFQIPEAIMKLRQGFGRLIRNMNDVGICIIMDTRLCNRKYGEIILNSLPVEAIPYKNISTLILDSQKFF